MDGSKGMGVRDVGWGSRSDVEVRGMDGSEECRIEEVRISEVSMSEVRGIDGRSE